MNSSSIPWNILSSSVNAGIASDGWTLAEVGPDPEELRTFLVPVAFVTPFSLPPVIHLGLTTLDADQRDTTRISLSAGTVTESGFEAVVSTWSTSRIYEVGFHWLAIGA